MSVRATYSVQVGWPAIPEDTFALDRSQLGSADTLADELPATMTDMSAIVKRIAIKRGRTGNLDAYGAGEATVILHDPDGDLNPLNDASTYAPVVPNRKITITATYGTATYGLFYGVVRSIEHDPISTARETRLTCQDVFLTLSRANPVITTTGATTTGGAIQTVLDAVGWDGAAALEPGDNLSNFYCQGDKSALSAIQELLEVERGEFFHGKGGTVTYNARHRRYARTSSVTLTDVATSAAPATDLQNIRNRAKVGNGVYSVTYEDGASVTNFGPSDASEVSSAYITSPAQATGLARWLVNQQAAPSPPLRSLDYIANKTDALMTNALARELGDRITVTDAASGVASTEFWIEGIQHEITAGGTKHAVSFDLTRASSLKAIYFGTSRAVGSTFSSPTVGTAPYTTTGTLPDIFTY